MFTEVGPAPWAQGHRLVHIGLQGVVPALDAMPARNLVFLLDVSGSMMGPDRIDLVKFGLESLTSQLGPRDWVSIVVYAGAAGAVLEPTAGDDRQTIIDALERLEAGGSTNGAEGIELAYELAQRNFVEGGINRVLLATDGDFNVGISDHDALMSLIEAKRESGVFLSVLGVGSDNFADHMLEQLADKGNGNYAYIDSEAEARKVLVRQAGSTLDTIAKDVKIQVEFDPKLVLEHRLIGYENRVLAHRDFADDRKDAGEIGAGHTVTALYEIVPGGAWDEAAAIASLSLRYKTPTGNDSRLISEEIHDAGRGLDESSADYRFSAAVAAFGDRLRGRAGAMRYAQILELAQQGLGPDFECDRHEFLRLVHAAGELEGETVPGFNRYCAPTPADERAGAGTEPGAVAMAKPLAAISEAATSGWPYILEVLRLLPPLLAFPLFILAWGNPRRRRG